MDRLEGQVDALVDAFAAASAWQGTTRMNGSDVPAAMTGSMVLCEFVLHGWDLATATGGHFDCEPATAEAIEHVMHTTGEQGRAMGAFGPAVGVAETAPALDRALGLAGRDPNWRA